MHRPILLRLLPRPAQDCNCSRTVTRSFNSSIGLLSGHSRWAKIKHDKGKADKEKSKARSFISKELATASKNGGPDPGMNPQLSVIIANAKKMGFPKASIETAIASGQGVTLSGRPLEQMTVDFMLPESNVAGLIECHTDSKARTMQHIRETLKHYDGTAAPTAYMFDRKGKIVFSRETVSDWDEDRLFEVAVEAGAEDIDVSEEQAVVLTEPNAVAAVAEALATQLGVKPASQDLIWEPKEDMTVDVTPESADRLERMMERLEDDNTVTDIYLNTA